MAQTGSALLGVAGGLVIGMGLERAGGVEALKDYVQDTGLSLDTVKSLYTIKLAPAFASLFASLGRLKDQAVDAAQKAMPKKDALELPMPEPSTSPTGADPDAVSTVKLLVVAAAGGVLYGAYRVAEFKLGKEQLVAYRRAVCARLAGEAEAVRTHASTVAARVRAIAGTHVAAAHTAGIALAAAAYSKSGAAHALAAAKVKALALQGAATPYMIRMKVEYAVAAQAAAARAVPYYTPMVAKYQELSAVATKKYTAAAIAVEGKAMDVYTHAETTLIKWYALAEVHARTLVKGMVLKLRVTTGTGLVRAGLTLHMNEAQEMDDLVSNLKHLSKSLEDKYPCLVKEVEELAIRIQNPALQTIKPKWTSTEEEYQAMHEFITAKSP